MFDQVVYLGPFELAEPIMAGGMAIIHRGMHRYSGEVAAIKIIKPDQLRDASRRRALRREIHTIAALDHPNIVRLFDVGEISGAQARASRGYLPEGAPWYAMEYVEGGSLAEAPPPAGWEHTRGWLLQLLDALSHAHAAEVVHRDLKPGNILLGAPEHDGPAQLKLVDFGIAQLLSTMEAADLGDQTSEYHVSGTPRYMAPEQVAGRHREQGPWTDLYALGCLAWYLVCGDPPFAGGIVEVMRQHLHGEPPALAPAFAVPEGLEAWLGRLLAKKTHGRFRRAADAAAALLELGPAMVGDEDPTTELSLPEIRAQLRGMARPSTGSGSLPTLAFLSQETTRPSSLQPSPSEEPTAELDLGRAASWTSQVSAEFSQLEEIGLDEPPGPPTLVRPMATRLPHSWERIEAGPHGPHTGASLGLFGMRTPPLVGRLVERDRLWTQLRKVTVWRQPQLVMLRGPQGAGVGRLARWLTRRAHEVGATVNLTAHHNPHGGALDGVRGMLTRHLRCAGLRGEDLRRHLRRVCLEDPFFGLPAELLEPLAELLTPPLHPGDDEEASDARATMLQPRITRDTRWRHEVLATLIGCLSQERAVLLWFDDIHWSPESIGLVEALLELAPRTPALLLCTIDADRLEEVPAAAARLAELSEQPRCATITMAPLTPREHRAFLEALLPLEPALAEDLAQRTEGHPGFALQLLDEWIRRDALIERHEGFELREQTPDALPESLQELWRRRLVHLLDAFPRAQRRDAAVTLEIAAALGRHVHHREWRTACDLADVSGCDEILDALLAHRLATPHELGWSFTHALLREALLRQAREAARLSRLHAHCAEMLERLYPQALPELTLRRAHHLAEGGEHARAERLHARAAEDLARAGERARALETLERRGQALELLDGAPGSQRWGSNLLRIIGLAVDLQQLHRAREALQRFEAHFPHIEDAPRHELRSRYELERLRMRINEGRLERTVGGREELLEALRAHPRDRALTHGLRLMGRAHELSGLLEQARQLYALCWRHAHQIQAPRPRALAGLGLVRVLCACGQLEAAADLLARTRILLTRAQLMPGLLEATHCEAALARQRGDRARAIAALEAVAEELPNLDAPLRARHQLQVLIDALSGRDLPRATDAAEALERLTEALSFDDIITHQAALVCYGALRGEHPRASPDLAILGASLKRAELATPGLVELLDLAAQLLGPHAPEPSQRAQAMADQLDARIERPPRAI